MSRRASTYRDIVSIVTDYLGPAGPRFVDRQIQSHLGKKPENITPKDVVKLIDWVKISFAFLTEDRQMIKELGDRLARIAREQPKSS